MSFKEVHSKGRAFHTKVAQKYEKLMDSINEEQAEIEEKKIKVQRLQRDAASLRTAQNIVSGILFADAGDTNRNFPMEISVIARLEKMMEDQEKNKGGYDLPSDLAVLPDKTSSSDSPTGSSLPRASLAQSHRDPLAIATSLNSKTTDDATGGDGTPRATETLPKKPFTDSDVANQNDPGAPRDVVNSSKVRTVQKEGGNNDLPGNFVISFVSNNTIGRTTPSSPDVAGIKRPLTPGLFSNKKKRIENKLASFLDIMRQSGAVTPKAPSGNLGTNQPLPENIDTMSQPVAKAPKAPSGNLAASNHHLKI